MKKLFLIILITQQFVFGLTNEELLKPSNNAIDFTFSSLDASPDTFSPEQTVSRVEMDVEKILGFIPRHFKTNTCGTDTYGNNYCNEALSECSQEWDYENGYSVSGVGQVVDYASKLTSTNYQNAGTRNILANLNLAGTVLCDSRYHFWGEGNRWYSSYYNGNPSKGDSSYLTFNFDKNYNMVRINGRMFQDSIFDTWTNNTNIVVFHNNGSPRGSITFNVINGNYSITGEARTERTTIKTDGSNCLYFDDCHGRGIQKLCFEPVYQTENYCPQGWVYNGYVEQGCSQNILICPSGYTETTGTETANGQCKKDISYTFYEYKCSDAQNSQDYNYIPQNTGGDCNKVDTDTTAVNSTTLDDACNSSTPPTNNCKREKFTCVADSNRPCAKVDNKWQCSPFACNNDLQCGYATCNGLPTSNTAIMPYEYHPIEALTRSGDACIPIQCDADYEYDDGTATKIDKKVCDGEVVGGKCVEYEYADKIGTIKETNALISTSIVQVQRSENFGGPAGSNGCNDYISNSLTCNQNHGQSAPTVSSRPANSLHEMTYFFSPMPGVGLYSDIYSTSSFYCTSGTLTGSKCITNETQCPDGYSEYGSSTQCRKETDIGFKEYYYHTIECPTDTNSFGNTWELLADNTNPGCLDDTFGNCINFEPLSSQCIRKLHTCPNGSGTCTDDNGNGVFTCSYDGCDSTRYPCIGQICDLALNDRISYCTEENCPTVEGVYEADDGSCKIMACPDGTYEMGDACVPMD